MNKRKIKDYFKHDKGASAIIQQHYRSKTFPAIGSGVFSGTTSFILFSIIGVERSGPPAAMAGVVLGILLGLSFLCLSFFLIDMLSKSKKKLYQKLQNYFSTRV